MKNTLLYLCVGTILGRNRGAQPPKFFRLFDEVEVPAFIPHCHTDKKRRRGRTSSRATPVDYTSSSTKITSDNITVPAVAWDTISTLRYISITNKKLSCCSQAARRSVLLNIWLKCQA